MPKGPFLSSEFVPTKFSTTQDKADFGNTFLHFIEYEWARTSFSKSFYNRLSMCFSHIAHYDAAGFYETWFTSDADRLSFLRHTLVWPCWGDPEYTFCDVERAIQQEIRKRNYLARYELRAAEAAKCCHRMPPPPNPGTPPGGAYGSSVTTDHASRNYSSLWLSPAVDPAALQSAS
jgi:hypothetical protein